MLLGNTEYRRHVELPSDHSWPIEEMNNVFWVPPAESLSR